MPLLKEDKKQLAKQYLEQMDGATNAVVLSHAGIPVNEMNAVRMDIAEAKGVLRSVKKRVFLKAVDGNYDGLTEEALDGSVMMVYSHNDEDQHAPLKVIAKHKKIWKKQKHEFGFDFIGGWYEKVWKDGGFVTEIANLPSKEELIGKFLFLLNHPIASFARGLKAIADQSGETAPTEDVKAEEPAVAETTTEDPSVEEAVTEQPAEETAPEESKEENKEEEVAPEGNEEATQEEQSEEAAE